MRIIGRETGFKLQVTNGVFSVTIPFCLVRDHQWEKGDWIRFYEDDSGMVIIKKRE